SSHHCLIYLTCADNAEAEHIARHLLAEGLIACANLFPPIRSLYHWQGELQHETESAMLLKTRRDVLPKLESRILQLHSYDTPCMVVLPIEAGYAAFLEWIDTQLIKEKP